MSAICSSCRAGSHELCADDYGGGSRCICASHKRWKRPVPAEPKPIEVVRVVEAVPEAIRLTGSTACGFQGCIKAEHTGGHLILATFGGER